jgi:hypothetical protein|tara:strand:+ start:309 stop:545 length:237 start_codon:yes stop_codon:yes gene_type:complete
METEIRFYEESHLYETIKTDLVVKAHYVEYKLNQLVEYRANYSNRVPKLWAEVRKDGKMQRYVLENDVFEKGISGKSY